jgi:tRNA(Ile)-lysidine synthase
VFQRFQQYCTTHRLHHDNSQWLLAVSGGIDSMTLAHLCCAGGFAAGIAHCNFSLRGADSDGDEQFVQQWAQAHRLPFFSIRFDTKRYAEERGISTQMAARDLRYAWFEEIRTAQHFTDLVVAHHADDNAETLLLNLTRGTGLKGLCGMQPVNGYIIRPLLFATRKEIEAYAAVNNIAYREDCTNAQTDYARNHIRHNVVPALQKINPAIVESMSQTAQHLTQAHRIIAGERKRIAATLCSHAADGLHISIAALKQTPHYDFWLFELLQPYNFSGAVVAEILEALNGQSGKRFYSASHELLKDREALIIVPRAENKPPVETPIAKSCNALLSPVAMQFDYRQNDENFVLLRDQNIANLAVEKLKFPLTLRLWREGDTFRPLGMKGFKKVSDFLIDEKVSLHDKSQQYVLVSGDDIVWLAGRRIDERYKITDRTKEIAVISIKNKTIVC